MTPVPSNGHQDGEQQAGHHRRGEANFRSRPEWFTMAWPRKITMAAKPRLVRYSNWKALAAPSVPR